MAKPTIPLAWLTEEQDSNGETILTGKLGRARLVGRLMQRDDGVRLWAIGLTENDTREKERNAYARRKGGGLSASNGIAQEDRLTPIAFIHAAPVQISGD